MTRRKPACLTRKSRRGNVDYAMGRILKENPGITESESLPIFRAKVLADDDLLEACLFECHAAARNRAYRRVDDAPTREEKRRRAQEKRARVAEMYERKKVVLILNYVMPCGLPLRKCTFAYAKEVGGAFARIGDRGEPDQIIGDVLSDEQADAAFNELAAANGREEIEREGPAFRARLRQLEREQAE